MTIQELKSEIARLDREIERERQRHAAALLPRSESWLGDTAVFPEGGPEPEPVGAGVAVASPVSC